MTPASKFARLSAAGALLLALAAMPASAETATTMAFLANVHPNVDFLDQSSRMAMDHSSNPKLRRFAHDEALEQTVTANSLVAWTQSNTYNGAVGAIAETDTLVPVVATGNASVDVPDLVTGRSVAVDVPLAPIVVARVATPHELLPAGREDLDRLQGRHGRGFDALYRSTQTSALQQLATLYGSYAAGGDDPALRAIAMRELPRVRARLAQLRRM